MDLGITEIVQLPLVAYLMYQTYTLFKEYQAEKAYGKQIATDSVSALNKLVTAIERNTEALNRVERLVGKENNR